MKQTTLLSALASALVARSNCIKSGNAEWLAKHEDRIAQLAQFLPSGSGFDCGTKVDLSDPRGMARSNGRTRIVLTTSFHHMDEQGGYDGWTEHTVTIKPDLLFGFDLSIGGRNRNDWKDYAHDVFTSALEQQVIEAADGFTLAQYAKNTDSRDAAREQEMRVNE